MLNSYLPKVNIPLEGKNNVFIFLYWDLLGREGGS